MARYLELLARALEKLEAEFDDSRWLPLLLLAAFSFALFFAADTLVQIYSMHPVIVFVPVGYGPPPL
jgi:hypothetical protein